MSLRYPKRLVRALALLAFALAAHSLYHRLVRPKQPALAARSAGRERLDFAWGSALHRLHNHAPVRESVARPLPWLQSPQLAQANANSQAALRIWIVTSELSGLHQNGGIGTAYRGLALLLAGQGTFDCTILVAHPESKFSWTAVNATRRDLEHQGVHLQFLPPPVRPISPPGWSPTTSVNLLHHLRTFQDEVDVLHFAENTGIGYFTALARFEGIAFERTTIVVGLHGPEGDWASILNKRLPEDHYSLVLATFERRLAELADVVVSPSHYMLSYLDARGWKLPKQRFVIPNMAGPQAPSLQPRPRASSSAIEELVFFGRLEERKGLRIFLEAISLTLHATNITLQRITLLGRDTTEAESGMSISSIAQDTWSDLSKRLDALPELQIKTSLDREAALDYLSDPSRVAVMPSLVDNSPGTVLECLSRSIRFIASSAGGAADLIDKADHADTLFNPTSRDLSHKLLNILNSSAILQPARPSAALLSSASDWVSLHHWLSRKHSVKAESSYGPGQPTISIVVTHFNRPALLRQTLASLQRQTYRPIQVVVVDDGSIGSSVHDELASIEQTLLRPQGWTLLKISHSYLGEARNIGASKTSGEYLLFLDDDDVLFADAIQKLVAVACRTQADALSTFLEEFAGPSEPSDTSLGRQTYWFAGQSLGLGALSNNYGSGNLFIKRKAFEAVGGYSTYSDLGAEDWELYVKLELANLTQLVVPDQIIWVRTEAAKRDSMKYSMDQWSAAMRANVPLLSDVRFADLSMRGPLLLARSAIQRDQQASHLEASSRQDFKLVQGWKGWHYAFLPVDDLLASNLVDTAVPSRTGWRSPATASDQQPFIASAEQLPGILSTGEGLAAVRIFTTADFLDAVVEVTYDAQHLCGDGTELLIISLSEDTSTSNELWRKLTLQEPKGSFSGRISFSPGDQLRVVVLPLDTDRCDQVEVKVIIRRSSKRAAWKMPSPLLAAEPSKDSIVVQQSAAKQETFFLVDDQSEANVESDRPAIALIFDENRLDYALQVMRSASHFGKPGRQPFHLITPKSLHEVVRQAATNLSTDLFLYDYSDCELHTAWVKPFSDPRIHQSALCKPFIAQILPESLERVLLLDNDITILSDLERCWAPLQPSDALLGMAVDMGDTCQLNPDACWPMFAEWRASDDSPPLPAQVNGGVLLMELERMRQTSFISRFINSVVQTYDIVGKPARFGDQDFLNSFFRLYPRDLAWLPCGCNYQYRGNRRSDVCGSQPLDIAHAWRSGASYAANSPLADLFDHFLLPESSMEILQLPVPQRTEGHSGSASSLNAHRNCPHQSFDCSAAVVDQLQYGSVVHVLAEPGARSDLWHSRESAVVQQVYSRIRLHTAQPNADLGASDPEKLSNLLQLDAEELRRLCSQPSSASDARGQLLKDLDEPGWVVYLEETLTVVDHQAIGQLLAQLQHEDEVLVFALNTTQRLTSDVLKRLHVSDMPLIGFVHHSKHSGFARWDQGLACGKWRTLQSFARHLSLRWTAAMPLLEHPLLNSPDDGQAPITLMLRRSEGDLSGAWMKAALAYYARSAFSSLFGRHIILGEEAASDEQMIRVTERHWTAALSQVQTEAVLLLDSAIVLEEAAILCMLSHWQVNRKRSIGPLAKLERFRKIQPYNTHLSSNDRWRVLSDRALMIHREHLQQLSLHAQELQDECPSEALAGLTGDPLRVLLPERSLVDRAQDCGLAEMGVEHKEPARCIAMVEAADGFSPLVETNEVGLCGVQGGQSGVTLESVAAVRWAQQRKGERCIKS